MEFLTLYVEFGQDMLISAINLTRWFATPLVFGITPLALVSISGLLLFLSIAIVKWLVPIL